MIKEWEDLEHDLELIEAKKYEDPVQKYQARPCLTTSKLCLQVIQACQTPEGLARPVLDASSPFC